MRYGKTLNGWEGIYQVSNTGKIRRLFKNKTRELKGVIKKGGYKSVLLKANGKYKCELIHRLVAKAFIPNPNDLPQVNHKDENKLNNNIDNLEWCTAKYNSNYGTKNERLSKTKTNNTYNITPVQCVETGIIYPSIHEAERQTGIHATAIQACCKRVVYCERNGYTKRHTAGGYHWKYVKERVRPKEVESESKT